MNCHKCDDKAVLNLQHGALCKNHFLSYFEEKVFKTINKYQMIKHEDRICVAASGGKDSLTALHLTLKYLKHHNLPADGLFALAVDEGIGDSEEGYRAITLKDLKNFCRKHQVRLEIIGNKSEFGSTLDEAFPIVNWGTKKKPCNICGVWRRYLLNKYAKKFGATKVITGHNLDDEAQAIMMNIFKAHTSIASHIGPVSGIKELEGFVQRVKPLYFCTEKETRLYALLKGFQVQFVECPYARQGFRAKVQEMLNGFEAEYPGTKHGVVQSFLALLPTLKAEEKKNNSIPQPCGRCGEPANGAVCNACKIVEVLRIKVREPHAR